MSNTDTVTVWAVEINNEVIEGGLPREVAEREAEALAAQGETGIYLAEYTLDEGSSAVSRVAYGES